MFYIIWLNVVCALHFITVARSKMYCMGIKSMAPGLTFLPQSNTFYSLLTDFTVFKWNEIKACTIFNH